MISDMVTTPLVKALNPMDAINKLVLSRYSYTQVRCSGYALGTAYTH